MKDNVLITLADEHFLDQAKQLFSSAYWNGGWNGDYMLLAYNVPKEKLAWFKEKGILIKHVSAPPVMVKENYWDSNYSPIVLAKFYVFTTEFKQWKHVLFLDSDIIVKSNINAITNINGFGAVTDMLPFIGSQINDYVHTTMPQAIINAKAFNSGVFCFSTDIITNDTFKNICAIASEYIDKTIFFPDQAILNIYFYKKWKRIPFFFNVYYIALPQKYKNNPSRVKCVLLHFAGEYKPWDAQSPYREEWEKNLRMADVMDLNNTRSGAAYSFNIFNALYYHYLHTIEFRYLLEKIKNKIKPYLGYLGLLFGYFKNELIIGGGWHTIEYHNIEKRFFIWNSQQSEIIINSNKITKIEFDIMFSPYNKNGVIIETYNNDSLIIKREYRAEQTIVHIVIDVVGITKIKFSNHIFIPAYKETGSRDLRKLGVMLMSPIIIHKNNKVIYLPLQKIISYKYTKIKKQKLISNTIK